MQVFSQTLPAMNQNAAASQSGAQASGPVFGAEAEKNTLDGLIEKNGEHANVPGAPANATFSSDPVMTTMVMKSGPDALIGRSFETSGGDTVFLKGFKDTEKQVADNGISGGVSKSEGISFGDNENSGAVIRNGGGASISPVTLDEPWASQVGGDKSLAELALGSLGGSQVHRDVDVVTLDEPWASQVGGDNKSLAELALGSTDGSQAAQGAGAVEAGKPLFRMPDSELTPPATSEAATQSKPLEEMLQFVVSFLSTLFGNSDSSDKGISSASGGISGGVSTQTDPNSNTHIS